MPLAPRVPRPDAATVAERAESCLKMARKLARRLGPRLRVDADDALSSAYLGLVRAANAYDPSFGVAFSTYAYRAIVTAVVRDAQRWHGRRPAPLPDVIDHRPGARSIEACEEAERALSPLPDADRATLSRRFGLDGLGGAQLKELGAEWGVTRQGAGLRVVAALARARSAIA